MDFDSNLKIKQCRSSRKLAEFHEQTRKTEVN